MNIKGLAQVLAKDLSEEGLVRYMNEQQRLMCNETKYGRSIRVPLVRFKAALVALELKHKKGA